MKTWNQLAAWKEWCALNDTNVSILAIIHVTIGHNTLSVNDIFLYLTQYFEFLLFSPQVIKNVDDSSHIFIVLIDLS